VASKSRRSRRKNGLVRMARRVNGWLDHSEPDPTLETQLEKDLWDVARSLRMAGEDTMSEVLAARLNESILQRSRSRIVEYIEKCRERGEHDTADQWQGVLAGFGEDTMALTPMEISKQMLEADKIRALKERENWDKERGEMQDRVGKGLVSACDDIYRRVFEEGWYGRTVHDVIYERQLPKKEQGEAVDQEEQLGKREEEKEIEDILKTMYGTGQGPDDDIPQQGRDQGMGY
jgi:hypothetical protein